MNHKGKMYEKVGKLYLS